jgi:hypothetical protein
MTWAKLSDDFTDRTEYLSDRAFRLHVEGLVTVMKREQGPVLPLAKVRRSTNVEDLDEALAELLACGFWREVDGGVEVAEHMEHQPETDVIARRREMAAARQRKIRRNKAGLKSEAEPETAGMSRRDQTRDQTRDEVRDFGTGRSGTGRSGEEHHLEEGKSSPLFAGVDAPDCPRCFEPLSGCLCGHDWDMEVTAGLGIDT